MQETGVDYDPRAMQAADGSACHQNAEVLEADHRGTGLAVGSLSGGGCHGYD
jgi:hypothetical protein